ncbi:hypothetical protein GCM10012280_34950 [Wenjunlia tyrosinilytica]|uniref:Uncharacterized protein n=1 Tax=Wenjunlia tyrosinilytica TaxID=1544741 RepID=A0A918DXV9_9ACTN|nr:hypothetical protein GCM10012280_34950 [Wenjunlia tyrosinilytica]
MAEQDVTASVAADEIGVADPHDVDALGGETVDVLLELRLFLSAHRVSSGGRERVAASGLGAPNSFDPKQ